MRKVLDKKARIANKGEQKAVTNAGNDGDGMRKVPARNSADSRGIEGNCEGDKAGTDVQRVRHAGGRPNGYRPEFCETIIELGKAGKFKNTWGLGCKSEANPHGVNKVTILEWAKTYPEFSNAFMSAELYFEEYWSNLMNEQATEYPDASSGRGARNNNATKFVLSACCGYREKSDLDVTSNGNSIMSYIEAKRGK